MPDLSLYAPAHRAELEELLQSSSWQSVLRSGLLEEVKAEKIAPGSTLDFIGTVVDQLLESNEEKVRALIGGGLGDREKLFAALSRWPDRLDGRTPKIAFLGLNVTAECNFVPRCLYCNQPWVAPLPLEDWKRLIGEVTAANGGKGPYVYTTGGEPLLRGREIWGDDGLIAFAARRGAAVNLNTNASLITPRIALRLVKAGLAKVHISLDAADPPVQNFLFGGDRLSDVLRGIYNLQLARELAGVSYPEIHTNCVLTRQNLDLFPELFGFILEKRQRIAARPHPLYHDLFPHVIPVGGQDNAGLRPSAGEFRRFYEEIWPRVCHRWEEYQKELGIPPEKRGVLFGYFSNPFLRVAHQGGLDAYLEASAQGHYARLALPRYCYVAATQGSFTPDGYQFRCGAHAIRRALPIGRIGDGNGFFDHLRAGIAGLDELPQEEHCQGCALATLYINQTVEAKLAERLDELLQTAVVPG